MNDKNVIVKKIKDALLHRDSLKKKSKNREATLFNLESHIQTFYTVLFGKHSKDVDLYNVVPNYHITAFPVFVKNSKYILSVFNIGVPTKYPVKGCKQEDILYTVGYKSKRLFYKHQAHPVLNDDYIVYHCRTFYENNFLVFEVKTDDGLIIKGDRRTVFAELQSMIAFSVNFSSIEDFFGLCSAEVNDLIIEKYDLLRK